MVDSRVPVRVPGTVEAEVDGDRVLLSPRDFSYFGAEGTGAPIWDLIDGQRTVEEIVAELETRFDAVDGTIRADTRVFLDALGEAGLIEELDESSRSTG